MSLTRQTRTGAVARVGQLTAIAAITTLTACASAKPSSEPGPAPAPGMAADWSKDARVGESVMIEPTGSEQIGRAHV